MRGNYRVSCALLSRSASCSDGWKAAADPARFAIQFAPTTRLRKAVPWPKNAVSHMYNLHLFHLLRTLDAIIQPTDTTSHTTWVGLLQPIPREQIEEDRAAELEYDIESIISHRGKGKNNYYKNMWVGYTEDADEWLPHARLRGPRLDEYESN